MRIYILALSLFVSTLAIAQPPVDKPADKPEETKEKKDDKPKEKKDKKPRTFRLIGVEASAGNVYYGGNSTPSTTSGMYKGFIDKDSPFFSIFGENATTNYGYNYLSLDYQDRGRWHHYANQYDFISTWGFGKKGDVNPKHVIKIGAGFGNRSYNTVDYYKDEFSQIDTIGYTYIGNDTVVTIKDSSVFVGASISNYARLGHVSLAYNYRLHADEKLSLSFGGGMDIGFGTLEVLGVINRYTERRIYGRTLNGQPGWNYYDHENYINKSNLLGNIDNNRFKVASFRPYVNLRVDYRLSKKLPLLKNINVFVDGRWGKEFSTMNKKMYANTPTFISWRVGIAYNFRKGL